MPNPDKVHSGTVDASTLIFLARDLQSEDGDNPEYDRALVELVGFALGYSSDDLDHVRGLIAREIQPVSSHTSVPAGKTVYRYEIEADSLRDALDRIPGDFIVYWHNQDRRQFSVEVIRTF